MNTKIVNGVELIVQNDMVVRASKDTNEFEPESFVELDKHLIEGQTFVDVGAYTGIYSIYAAKHGCKSVAFEPNFVVYERLRQNVKKFDWTKVCIINGGVSDYDGMAYFKTGKSFDMTSAGYIDERTGDPVPIFKLDKFDFGEERVCAIKIDVEGGETKVLKGALELIKRDKPFIITEVLDDQSRIEVAHIMKIELGYKTSINLDGRNIGWIYEN